MFDSRENPVRDIELRNKRGQARATINVFAVLIKSIIEVSFKLKWQKIRISLFACQCLLISPFFDDTYSNAS